MVGALGEHGRIPHQLRDRLGRWRAAHVEGHGRVRLRLGVCKEAYKSVGAAVPGSHRSTTVSALADTGAQMCVASMDVVRRMGLRLRDLVDVELRVNVAGNLGL